MSETVQLSLPLPRALDTKIHISITIRSKSILLLLTTRGADDASSPAPLGSFVYALPDRLNPTQPISTPLYSVESSLELATRVAKIVARKTQLPTYVGNSMSFANAGMGGTVEEEMEALKQVVSVVLEKLQSRSLLREAGSNTA